MANLPPNSIPTSAAGGSHNNALPLEQLILNINNPSLRENSILELFKNKAMYPNLAPSLWNSRTALIQEITSIYPHLSPPNLTEAQSSKIGKALGLLLCIASHPDTRKLFLDAHIPVYLYPFLETTDPSRTFEYLRLSSLSVIGGLVKVPNTEAVSYILSSDIISYCLGKMEMVSEHSKTVATFIIQKILLDDAGLNYMCMTAEHFFAVSRFLRNMVAALVEQPSARLLKTIVGCYLRLSHHPRAFDALKNCLPVMLQDGTFENLLQEDPTTRRWLQQLFQKLSKPSAGV